MTLKPMVEPRLTLMSVANPWIEALPEPVMCHSVLGLPVLVFSQAISLTTGASHGAAAAFGGGSTTRRTAPKLRARTALSRRCGQCAGRPKRSRRHAHDTLLLVARGYLGLNADVLLPRTQPIAMRSVRVLPPQSRSESSTLARSR